MRRRRIFQVLVVLAGAIAAAAALPFLRGLGARSDVPVARVERGTFEHKVQAEGNLKAVEATVLSAPMEATGPLKISWLAPDGSRVKAGDVVIRFDSTDMEKSLTDGEAERDTANNQIEGKEAEGQGTLRNLGRDADIAALELRYAKEFQSKDPDIFSRTEIIESEIDQNLATSRKDNAETARGTREKLNKVDLDLLGIERHKADLKIEQARKGLTGLEVKAPHDGILVFKREWRGIPKVGDTVWKGQPLAEIPRLDAMEAEVFVLEADAGGLAVGRPATVVLEAHPEETFQAKTRKVEALAKPRVSWVPVQYFGVTLALERTDPARMKPGQRVLATLFLEQRGNALTVPRGAVFEKNARKIVYRRKGRGFDPVEVSLGPSALGRVVVEKGLDEGDEIALRDPTRPEQEPGGGPEGGGTAEPAVPAAGGTR